jgi:hypothetical protein
LAGQKVEIPTPKSDLYVIADALCDIRDSMVLLSATLKDHFAETPSPLRDEVAILVERQLARLREGQRGNFE